MQLWSLLFSMPVILFDFLYEGIDELVALTVDGYYFSILTVWRLNFRAFDGWQLLLFAWELKKI